MEEQGRGREGLRDRDGWESHVIRRNSKREKKEYKIT